MATDKSQGLPVQPTEIEGINNEAQAAGGRTEQLIVKDMYMQVDLCCFLATCKGWELWDNSHPV